MSRQASAALGLASLLLVGSLPMRPPVAPRDPVPAPERGAARLLWGVPLDLNRETAHDLEALPGIGPARAAAIVAGRPYCAPEDLARVVGLGPATLRRLAGRVAVDPGRPCEAGGGD